MLRQLALESQRKSPKRGHGALALCGRGCLPRRRWVAAKAALVSACGQAKQAQQQHVLRAGRGWNPHTGCGSKAWTVGIWPPRAAKGPDLAPCALVPGAPASSWSATVGTGLFRHQVVCLVIPCHWLASKLSLAGAQAEACSSDQPLVTSARRDLTMGHQTCRGPPAGVAALRSCFWLHCNFWHCNLADNALVHAAVRWFNQAVCTCSDASAPKLQRPAAPALVLPAC